MMTKTSADFLVQGLEAIEPAYSQFQGEMFAGLMPVLEPEIEGDDLAQDKKTIGQMMFWMFEPQTQAIENTIVVWLNGGPGCSSFNCGALMENSPVTQPMHPAGYCCLEPLPKMYYNEKYAWTQATTMLYVEQPIGTGFSFGLNGYQPETEVDVARDLYHWLQYSFYQVFPKFRDYTLFVMGESYAGMFIPSIARKIMIENERRIDSGASKDWIIPLGGAALGNGWIDATIQGPATIDYSWWHGLIDAPTRHSLHLEWQDCLINYYDQFINKKPNENSKVDLRAPFHPFNVQDDCGIMWGVQQAAGGINLYDVTTYDPNVDTVTFSSEAFYNRDEVKAILHAPTNITWHGCRPGEGRRRRKLAQQTVRTPEDHRKLIYMINDRPVSVAPYIADLLNGGVPVLVYNGDRDMTTNMVGSELVLNQMKEWKNIDKWLDAPRGAWRDISSLSVHPEAGWAKEYGNLTYVVIYNSGHMVPYNVPSSALDMVKRFLTRQSFIDVELPQIRHSMHPSTFEKYKGAEDWMNLPVYPKLPEDHKAGENTLLYDYMANFPTWTTQKWELPGTSPSTGKATNWTSTPSFFAGMVVALVVIQLVNVLSNKKQKGYQPIPEASLEDDE